MTDGRDSGDRPRHLDTGSVIWGVILIAVGAWFFLDETLHIRLPEVPWGDLWPLLIIALGGWILFRAATRRA